MKPQVKQLLTRELYQVEQDLPHEKQKLLRMTREHEAQFNLVEELEAKAVALRDELGMTPSEGVRVDNTLTWRT